MPQRRIDQVRRVVRRVGNLKGGRWRVRCGRTRGDLPNRERFGTRGGMVAGSPLTKRGGPDDEPFLAVEMMPAARQIRRGLRQPLAAANGAPWIRHLSG